MTISRSPSSVECRLFAVPLEQRPAEQLFQPLDLLTDGRLGPVNPLARPGETAGVDDGDETAQKIDIDHGCLPIRQIHCYAFYHLISK